eukprot:scaffold95880_cov22-Tisochrysis_lutea.AAC.2
MIHDSKHTSACLHKCEAIGHDQCLALIDDLSQHTTEQKCASQTSAALQKVCTAHHLYPFVQHCWNSTLCFLTGRVDAFVSSTDKNFMVPVGGALEQLLRSAACTADELLTTLLLMFLHVP